MYPDHYAVPEGLNIRLIGTARWKVTPSGYHVMTLWREPNGNAYYCDDIWTPFVVPFWMSARMSDLIPCTPPQLEALIADMCDTITDKQERESLYHRLGELLTLWGCADGVDQGLARYMRKDQP